MPWWAAGCAGIGVLIAVAVWWWVPIWRADRFSTRISDPKALADIEDNWRKSISQLFAGAAVLVGAGFAYYQFLNQQQTTNEQIKTSRDQIISQQQASHDQLISQQVSKGFEQLASDTVTMRLGGIYALEGVMNTSAQYHRPVLEALCAFVRDATKSGATPERPLQDKSRQPLPGTKSSPERPSLTSDIPEKPSPTTDVQAALTVIGRRVNQTNAANLSHAVVPGADLFEANLSGAHLIEANLSKANLSKANLNKANLVKANLGEANLVGAYLFEANLSGAFLIGAFLMGADLNEADLSAANLALAKLNYAYLNEANLSGANLSGAYLSAADLSRTNLSGTNLSGANLYAADLSAADLSRTKLDDTKLGAADLHNAKNVSPDQLHTACGDANTKLPPGLTIKPCLLISTES